MNLLTMSVFIWLVISHLAVSQTFNVQGWTGFYPNGLGDGGQNVQNFQLSISNEHSSLEGSIKSLRIDMPLNGSGAHAIIKIVHHYDYAGGFRLDAKVSSDTNYQAGTIKFVVVDKKGNFYETDENAWYPYGDWMRNEFYFPIGHAPPEDTDTLYMICYSDGVGKVFNRSYLLDNLYIKFGSDWVLFHSLGEGEVTEVRDSRAQPSGFTLFQNFPNPFNPTTTIRAWIPKRTNVRLEIFNPLGQLILTKQDHTEGLVQWLVGENWPSGVLYYRLTVGNFVETKKMILLK